MDVKTGVGAAYFCHQYTTDENGIPSLSLTVLTAIFQVNLG